MVSKQEDRRKFPRAPFVDPVTIHKVVESSSGNVFEVQGKPIIAKGGDVSEGGIRIEIGTDNSPTKILKLNFKLQKDSSIDVYTKLVWNAQGECGLQFIVLDDEIREQIKAYVQKKAGI